MKFSLLTRFRYAGAVGLTALAIGVSPAWLRAQTACGTSPPSLTSPYLWVFANDVCTDLSSLFTVTGSGDTWDLKGSAEIGGSTLDFEGDLDADPFITFGVTTTNLVAGPVTYAFLFGTPIVPGFYSIATSTAGVSVTNGLSGTATVATSATYPTFVSGYGTLGLVPTNLGVDLGTTACTASGAQFQVTQTCNYGTTTNTFAPTFYDNLEAMLTYTQTDIASVASWSGAITLNPLTATAPEPSTIVLTASGLVGLWGVGYRRRHRPTV